VNGDGGGQVSEFQKLVRQTRQHASVKRQLQVSLSSVSIILSLSWLKVLSGACLEYGGLEILTDGELRKPISLISHSDVRYRGTLAGIDPQASTIQLENGEYDLRGNAVFLC